MKEFEIHEKVGLKSDWKEAQEMRTLFVYWKRQFEAHGATREKNKGSRNRWRWRNKVYRQI